MAMRVISTFVNPGNGLVFPYVYFAATNAGAITTSFNPFPYDQEVYESPAVFSPNKQLVRRWRYAQSGFVNQALPVEYGMVEYVPMLAPNGVLYIYQPDNNGTWQISLFTASASRTLTTTLMHKGNMVYVADNRFKIPRHGY